MRTRTSGWPWLLIAAALFVRAVVPQGFMPEREANGTVTIAVCHGVAIEVPLKKKESRDQSAHKDQPCAFTSLFAAADTPGDLALAIPPAMREPRLARPERAQAARTLQPRPPSRGPPAIA